MKLAARNIVALLVPLAVVACAQLQGLDSYENVDCVGDDCVDAGNQPDTSTGTDTGQPDTGPTCPPCTNGQVCDPKSLKCVECLPGTKECANGSFCDPDETLGYKCVLGCGVVDDCIKAGFGQDGGADAGDAGDAGKDGGDAGDAGDAGAFGPIACCNNRCVDTSLDGKNCGMCGNSCGASGACCNSTCLDIVSTPTSCGGCGIVCSGENITTPTCGAKTCTGTCDDGWADCNMNKQSDGCETDIFTNPNKCGGCNKVCSSNHVPSPVCTSGVCTGACTGNFRDCNSNKLVDGCETDISNDKLNCGGCDNVCSNNHITTPRCTGGNCDGDCDTGYKDCDSKKLVNGCETHISGAGADVNNCGDCNVVCAGAAMHVPTPSCNGACNGACETGFADCDNNKTVAGNGCEKSIFTDVDNCGACNAKCSSVHVPSLDCSNVGGVGKCTGACEAGWSDCDNNKQTTGCETRTDQDTLSCGACNSPCNTAGMRNCISGKCAAGYGATTTTPAVFIDACSFSADATMFVGRTLNTANDDEGTAFPFPPAVNNAMNFDFKFAGATPTNFFVSSNGILGFSATPFTGFSNQCTLPTTGTSDPGMIFGYWDDLITRSGTDKGICIAVIGAAPNRKLVATWADNEEYDNNNAHLTFSIILNEATYTIDVVYSDISGGADGSSATFGLQTNGTTGTGTLVSCDTGGVVQTGTKLRYIP